MIDFRKVSFSYEKGDRVLDSIDLGLQPGLTLLLGPNGCGKSTLLKLAAGVETPDSGQITVEGWDLWRQEVEARRRVAYLPEHPDLTPYATINEIIRLVCRLRGEPPSSGERALGFFDLLDHSHRTVRELSMGQRRRAVFAACLVGRPSCLLLDEPLEGMDLNIQSEILAWIGERTGLGFTLVVVSHFIEPFVTIATRAVTIKNEKPLHVEELPSDPERKRILLEELAKGLLKPNEFDGCKPRKTIGHRGFLTIGSCRDFMMSRNGGAPNRRAYSRLNCEALSYPT